MKPKFEFDQYPFKITPLAKQDGGGYLITFPDLPGCMSDGDTHAQAIKNGREALEAWMESVTTDGLSPPAPNSANQATNVEVRLPKSLHARLRSRASHEGVNVQSLVQVYVAEALGRREATMKRR